MAKPTRLIPGVDGPGGKPNVYPLELGDDVGTCPAADRREALDRIARGD
jgi:hypothetical protein